MSEQTENAPDEKKQPKVAIIPLAVDEELQGNKKIIHPTRYFEFPTVDSMMEQPSPQAGFEKKDLRGMGKTIGEMAVNNPLTRTVRDWGEMFYHTGKGIVKGVQTGFDELAGNEGKFLADETVKQDLPADEELGDTALKVSETLNKQANPEWTVTPEYRLGFHKEFWTRLAYANPEKYGEVASKVLMLENQAEEADKNRKFLSGEAEKKQEAEIALHKQKNGVDSLKGDDKRKWELAMKPEAWNEREKVEAFKLLGGGKNFNETMLLLKQLGAEGTDGKLSKEFAGAVTTRMQSLAQQFQNEAGKVSGAAKQSWLDAAKASLDLAAKIPSMAGNAVAVAIENAFGTNKEAMKIAQDTVLLSAYDSLDEDLSRAALKAQFPNAIFGEYNIPDYKGHSNETGDTQRLVIPKVSSREAADKSGSRIINYNGEILVKLNGRWFYDDGYEEDFI